MTGRHMYIADHLSRASVPNTGIQETESQFFTLELEELHPLATIKISSEKLSQLQEAKEQYPVMQTLETTISTGWLAQHDEFPIHIRESWNFRDELSLYNSLLFKNQNQRSILLKAPRFEGI